MSTKPRPSLLVVHDDNQVVRQIAKMTSEVAELFPARSSFRANAILDSDHNITAVLVGKAGDGVPATKILAAVRAKRSSAMCILLADSGDLSASIEALHSGVVDHVINPPLRERELLAILALPSPRPAMIPVPTVVVAQEAKPPV
jgi:PleD family two-component response regulator